MPEHHNVRGRVAISNIHARCDNRTGVAPTRERARIDGRRAPRERDGRHSTRRASDGATRVHDGVRRRAIINGNGQ